MKSPLDAISSHQDMERAYVDLARDLLAQEPFDRGEVHAQKTAHRPEMVTRELRHVQQHFRVPSEGSPGVSGQEQWAYHITPNLPWAEDHFQERVSGEPLNPPPSHGWWPFNQAGNAEHLIEGKFSHTYPERFWPRMASVGDVTVNGRVTWVPHRGIRFEFGDLNDVLEILTKNPRSRQAYLPVWFPEDLTAAREGQRVPCTLGYHFLLSSDKKLDMSYFMRSVDFVRFYRDDIYMAGRLLQWVAEHTHLPTGELIFHTANMHCFVGDDDFLRQKVKDYNPRANYNLDALL